MQINEFYQCCICLQACVRPTQCQGPCAKYFCFKCMSNAKLRNNRCPNRCSQPFNTSLLPEVPLPLACPYDPKNCPVAVRSLQDRREHFRACPRIAEDKRIQQNNKYLYRCHQGHDLTFLSSASWQIIYGISAFMNDIEDCHGCKERNSHRSVCLECSTMKKRVFYCHQCRCPPVSKRQCPLGHSLKGYRKVGKNRFCDLCDVPASMAGDIAYGQCGCEFDICQPCYNGLPEVHPLIPVRVNNNRLMAISLIEDVSSESEWRQDDLY